MPGTKGLVLQPRDWKLLGELVTMRVVDREQAMAVAGFYSATRAHTRLPMLTKAGLLNRFYLGTVKGGMKALYALTRKGMKELGVTAPILFRTPEEVLVGDQFVHHQLILNWLYIALKYKSLPEGAVLQRWQTFSKPISASLPLMPDGYLELTFDNRIFPMFLEVDRGTESLKVWQKKIHLYIRLATTGEFARLFHHPQFRVLVVTTTNRRAESLRKFIAKSTPKLFWLTSLEIINPHASGFFEKAWTRPFSEERHWLLERKLP